MSQMSPMSPMSPIFTKNLYIKEEVMCALLSAILLNQRETSLFWGLELFYSGYQDEVVDYLWTIYYSFHASLNASFEKYFIRKLSDAGMTRAHVIATIITNLCAKAYTTDVYVLLNNQEHSIVTNASFYNWLELKDYKSIASHIMSDSFNLSEDNMDAIREMVLGFYRIKWYRPMLLPSPNICLKLRFLSHIMQICTERNHEIDRKKQSGRSNLSSKHIDAPLENPLLTLQTSGKINILKMERKFHINCSNTLHLFRLARHDGDIKDIKKSYREDWLYYCSQTPYWSEKISAHGGTVNVENKTVTFDDATKEEEFVEKYWLEPDEQSSEVQDMSIGEIPECKGDAMMEFKTQFGKWDIFENYWRTF